MSYFSSTIQRFQKDDSRRNTEEFAAIRMDGAAVLGSDENGDIVKLMIRVEEDRVNSCYWNAFGSHLVFGVTAFVAAYIEGKGIDELLVLDTQTLVEALGGVPDECLYTVELVLETLRKTCNHYFAKSGQKERIVTGAGALFLCPDHDLTDKAVRKAYLHGKQNVREQKDHHRLGSCARCDEAIAERLEALRKEFPMNGQAHLR